MVFAHDTTASLRFAVELVNTLPSRRRTEDRLTDLDTLATLMASWAWTGAPGRTPEDLAAVQRLRHRLRDIWSAPPQQAAAQVNELLRLGHALPRLVTHEPYGWHVHATDDDAPVAERMAVEAAMAFVDVIRMGETDRLRTCAADDCDDLVLDLSKNRSRRYCDGTCATKAHVAAYRERRRSTS